MHVVLMLNTMSNFQKNVNLKCFQDEHFKHIVTFHHLDVLSTFNYLIFHMPPTNSGHIFLLIKHGSRDTICYTTIHYGEALM
jgi:hypothetical protein